MLTATEHKLAWQRTQRKLNGNSDTKKYEKTKRGFLMRLYRNMQSRIMGIQKQKAHLYVGKNLLEREVFYVWAMSSTSFHLLFDAWEKEDYPRKYTPSVDRINSTIGYDLANMEWVTMSENSSRGANNKYAASSNS
jgi:hypothetical protein